MKHLLTLSLLLLAFQAVFAQRNNVPVTQETPYNTIYSHLFYLQPETYHPEYIGKLFYGVEDSLRAQRLAIQLKQVLDGRGLYVVLSQLPKEVNFEDTLNFNSPTYTLFPDEVPQVYVEQINGRWYYSEETVNQIPSLHKQVYPFGTDILLNWLPQFGQTKLLGLAFWQYIGLLVLLAGGLIVYILLSFVLNPIINRLSQSKLYPSLIPSKIPWRIARYVSVFVVLWLIDFFLPTLQLPAATAKFAVTTNKAISIILLVLIGLRVLEIVRLYANHFANQTKSKMDEQLLPILNRIAQAVIVIGGVIQILSLFEVNVTALIAGISIGGLAIALAAQDTVKHLIGSAMIFVDRPFQIGDFVEIGEHMGTVVEVGFRSTRIQTVDSSIVAIPNGSVANSSLRNMGVRVYRLFQIKLGVTYDTPPALIELFISGIKQLIENHPKTLKETYYVYLNDLSDSSIVIFVRAQIRVPSYSDELALKEDMLLAIIRLAEELGVRFAFPSSTLYIEEFPEKSSSVSYEKDQELLNQKLKDYIEGAKKKFNPTEDGGL